MKTALVHDSFTQLGGAERVMEALHELFPEAPVYALVLDRRLKEKYRGWDMRTSWLQFFYNLIPRLQYLLPLIPLAVSSLKFEGYDLVISSSSGWAKNIHVPKSVKHICYCHTPTRFLWVDNNYVDHEAPAVLRPLARLVIRWMRKWDVSGARRVTAFIANSEEVQKRIKSIYHRDSKVLHPFIDSEFWKPINPLHLATSAPGRPSRSEFSANKSNAELLSSAAGEAGMDLYPKGDYFLLGGRLQAHKNNELIIRVFNELGLPLHVFGTGRREKFLRSIAGPNISFFGRISDAVLRAQYSGALAFIYPQVEDFGLMPLEAAACGTATIAYNRGGSLETVVPGITGELFSKPDKEIIKKIILSWDVLRYPPQALRAHAKKFSREKFKQQFLAFAYEHRS